MPDRADHPAFDDAGQGTSSPELEAARLRFATARVRALAQLERQMLELAVQAPDDDAACWLELWADTAWRDAHAMSSEHGTEETAWPQEVP